MVVKESLDFATKGADIILVEDDFFGETSGLGGKRVGVGGVW